MEMYVLIFIVCLLLPFTRCVIFNLHNVGIYCVRDLIDYIVHMRWKEFRKYGITMFIGMFGHGKTLTMVHQARALYAKYGDDLKFISNIKLVGIPYEPLVNFEQICEIGEVEDGRVGTVVLIDEISSVLSHRNYANFPLEMLNVLTQQRKKKVYIMCTAQRFFMVDKLFRGITTWVVNCNKYWRFQNGKMYDAWELENATNSRLLKHKANVWFFVKNKDYAAYDTSEMISKDASKDFISNDEAIRRKGLDAGIVFNDAGVNNASRKLRKMRKGK